MSVGWIDGIVGLIAALATGGVLSPVITGVVNRKKTAAEASKIEAETFALTEKSSMEIAQSLIDQFKLLHAEEKQRREELEKRFDELEKKSDSVLAEVSVLRRSLAVAEENLELSKREVGLLNEYIAEIRSQWASVTSKPFPPGGPK